jgi:Tfp pilus assembly ATPase PilU
MRDGALEGMQYFDGEIEKLVRNGTIDLDTGLGFSSNAGNLRLQLADFAREQKEEKPDDLLER